jgi:DNA-binding ferritin-like protein (Dps family)
VVDFYQHIVDMQSSVEDLARKIPGFKGYLEREDRREADRLLRDRLVRLLRDAQNDFTASQRKLVDSGGVSLMEQVQVLDNKLTIIIDKVDSAPRGYGGLFDAVKVNEKALADVYGYDMSLLGYVDQLMSGLGSFAGSIGTSEFGSVVGQLERVLVDFDHRVDKRSDVLKGLESV